MNNKNDTNNKDDIKRQKKVERKSVYGSYMSLNARLPVSTTVPPDEDLLLSASGLLYSQPVNHDCVTVSVLR
jgi:hypothetical protein